MEDLGRGVGRAADADTEDRSKVEGVSAAQQHRTGNVRPRIDWAWKAHGVLRTAVLSAGARPRAAVDESGNGRTEHGLTTNSLRNVATCGSFAAPSSERENSNDQLHQFRAALAACRDWPFDRDDPARPPWFAVGGVPPELATVAFPSESPPAPTRNDSTALLVLDMFSVLDGGAARALRPSTVRVVPALARLIDRARTSGVPVIYIDAPPDGWGASHHDRVRAALDSDLGELIEPIVPARGDTSLVRPRPSAFDHSPLEDLLRNRGVRQLVLAGQIAEQGVLYSALDATVRGFRVVIPRDAVATMEPPLGEAALQMMARNMQAQLTSSERIDLQGIAPRRPGRRYGQRQAPPIPGAHEPDGVSPEGRLKLRRSFGEKPSKLHEELLAALAVVVARDGFIGAKVIDVAREAHISLRTFYSEFESKEDAFFELHGRITAAVYDAVRSSVVFDQPWADATRQAFATYFELIGYEPRLSHALITEIATISDEGRRIREEAMELFAELLCELVAAGREAYPSTPSRPLGPLAARGFVAAFLELIGGYIANADDALADELVDTATQMLMNSVLLTSGEPSATTDQS